MPSRRARLNALYRDFINPQQAVTSAVSLMKYRMKCGVPHAEAFQLLEKMASEIGEAFGTKVAITEDILTRKS